MADQQPIPSTREAAAGSAGLLRPRVVLPALAVILVLAIVFTPQSTVGRVGSSNLTTYSTESQGARGLHDAMRRLGWSTSRRLSPFDGAASHDAVYLVLDPPIEPTAAEVHRLLDAVRAGASLVFVAGRGALSDSLRISRTVRGGPVVLDTAAVNAQCDTVSSGGLIDWPGGRPWLYALRRRGPLTFTGDTTFVLVTGTRARAGDDEDDEDDDERAGSSSIDTTSPDMTSPDTTSLGSGSLDTLELPDSEEPGDTPPTFDPAVIGFRLGEGRVLAVSDPDFLRNDVLRVCRWNMGVTAFAALDWVAQRPEGAPLRRAVFAEYHQGYGRHASVTRATREFLGRTAIGRTILALAAAALLLLAAKAARPLAPLSRARFERRSPLEHVGALSRAYEQAGATRTAARRLARGVRRRHAHGAWRRADDEEFLRSIAARHPGLSPEVERVIAATRQSVTPAELVQVGRAIAVIERTLQES